MSIPQHAGGPITSRDDLVSYFARGAKPKPDWRIGTEHEKFVFSLKDHKPLRYEGSPGIRQLLEGMQRFGWEPAIEDGKIIGLQQGDATLSLEPGGQFELSGAPLKSVHQTCSEVNTHRDQVREVCAEIGAGCLGIGFAPTWSFADTTMMPKGRYEIMRRYMPKVGGLGLEMMFRTCTIQTNLDYSDEADMVKKFRVALALQPVATALFANSPFREGKPNGFLSYRSHVWTDVDQARSGMVPFVFENGFGYERYVDYALKVPMYFVYRNDRYIDVAGKCFEDFLEHRIPEVKDATPTMSDWADHLTTIFPEVRLKTFLETRGADGGSWRRICAQPALWAGILYAASALDAAWDLVKDWTTEEREAMRQTVPKLGFKTPFRKTNLLSLARRMMEIATAGLHARAEVDSSGSTEEGFIQPLWEVVERGETRAEELLRKYRTEWKRDLAPLFKEYNFL